ncbi:hypothetical protein OAA60_03905 [Porticoccaceae bacterium]|nr:hypothetical protein [Porticoccaceae bacterium]
MGASLASCNAVFPINYNAVIPINYSTVIPTVAEGPHDVGSDSRFGISTQEILRLRSG